MGYWSISSYSPTLPPHLPVFLSLPAYFCRDALPSPGLAYGTFDFSCMRGGGLLERCQEVTKLKPLNVVQLYFFHLEIDVEMFNTVNIKCEFSRHIREGIWIKSFDYCSWQHCFQSWVDRGTVGVTFP